MFRERGVIIETDVMGVVDAKCLEREGFIMDLVCF